MSPDAREVRTDLVVVIDTSESMEDEAVELSAAIETAIETAERSCSGHVRHCCFGIEGTWDGTHFKQSYREYLERLGRGGDLAGRRFTGDERVKEDGAAAVQDLARYFDWREGAIRTIFYLGDEGLQGGDPRTEADGRAADSAIAAARLERVRVFTYFGTPLSYSDSDNTQANIADYRKLAVSTGGEAYTAPANDLGGFERVLASVICRKSLIQNPKESGMTFDQKNIQPDQEWNPSNHIQLDILNHYEAQRTVEGTHPGVVTCRNTGTVALKDVLLMMHLDDYLDSFDAVFKDTQDRSWDVAVGDLEPGVEKLVPYEVKLIRNDPTYQDAMERGYRMKIRPSFRAEFSFSQAGFYNVATLAEKKD